MARRLELHEVLCELLGSRYVYYQPPASISMTYPAIVYRRSDIQNKPADNLPYLQTTAYEVTVIDRNPDSAIVEAVSRLPYCRFNRHFTSENLNHDVFVVYY